MASDEPRASPRTLFAHEAGLMEALSSEDFRRLADARRAIWTSSLIGLAAGLAGGLAAGRAFLLLRPQAAAWWRGQHTGAVALGCGALGSFGASLVRARPAVDGISDVFERYRSPDQARFPYEAAAHERRRAEERRAEGARVALLDSLARREAARTR
jgi:hypothetical protein